MQFDVFREGLFWEKFYVPLAGRHNVLNTLAVLATLSDLGLDRRRLKEALPDFAGVKRRLEMVGDFSGITVVDDFAHHPTAVAETLLAARGRFPGRRLLVAFEPRTNTSRRAIFQKDYVQALAGARFDFRARSLRIFGRRRRMTAFPRPSSWPTLIRPAVRPGISRTPMPS